MAGGGLPLHPGSTTAVRLQYDSRAVDTVRVPTDCGARIATSTWDLANMQFIGRIRVGNRRAARAETVPSTLRCPLEDARIGTVRAGPSMTPWRSSANGERERSTHDIWLLSVGPGERLRTNYAQEPARLADILQPGSRLNSEREKASRRRHHFNLSLPPGLPPRRCKRGQGRLTVSLSDRVRGTLVLGLRLASAHRLSRKLQLPTANSKPLLRSSTTHEIRRS
jgi:hypothetical protein